MAHLKILNPSKGVVSAACQKQPTVGWVHHFSGQEKTINKQQWQQKEQHEHILPSVFYPVALDEITPWAKGNVQQ